jgi:DNA-binding MarR family transcriptional regulator
MALMDNAHAAVRFAELFGGVYRRFYKRIPVGQHLLTSESTAALQHLIEAGPLTVAEAAAHLGRSQSAMSEMIDRLERRGLVARVVDTRDRRRTLVWLTDDGRDALDEARQVLSESRLRDAFAGLDDAERKMLIDLMSKLIDLPDQSNDERGSD